MEFQSTRPARGATISGHKTDAASIFQSTRPARGATGIFKGKPAKVVISIHAPREGRDA